MRQVVIKTNKQQILFFLKSSLLLALFFSFLLCLTLKLMFIGFQIELEEATWMFFETLAVTSFFILVSKLSWVIIVVSTKNITTGPRPLRGLLRRITQPVLAFLITVLFSCNGHPLAGVSKDLNTGMVTTYSKIKPEETVLVMNQEKLGHTQIPLGEKFIVVNSNVQGLIVKDNKISVGCSLIISDLEGKELLREEDLFKDNSGIFNEKDAEYLKCTVSTGKPMEYDKHYNVAVRFWDKYGTGTIDNKFSIEIIDVP